MAYFDWNATAPLLEEARSAWLDASESAWANPSTSYRMGVQARLLMEKARGSIAGLFGVQADQVIFTSGATEANNGMLREAARRSQAGGRVWISSLEHPSVRVSAMEYWGADRVIRIPVGPDGRIDLDWIDQNLNSDRPALISVMAVNNESGVIQPWQEVLSICQRHGVPFHCDAVQWMGKLDLTNQPWAGCAGISFSGHKFGGPKGTGCLILGPEWRGLKVQTGGSQEFDSRAGTENVAGVAAMVAALEHRVSHPVPDDRLHARDLFEKKLTGLWGGEMTIHAKDAERVWNTCSVSLPDHRSSRWIAHLDKLGFQVSSGSACSAGKEGPSSALAAMGVDPEVGHRTLRISSGWETKPEDWDHLYEAICATREKLDQTSGSTGPGKVIEI